MDFSLNYVWIQAVKFPSPEEDQEIACPIPQGLFSNIIKAANDNPDVPIRIWVDIYGIGGHPAPVMQSLNSLNSLKSAPNITFKSLDSIPAYQTDPLFEKPHVDFEHPYDPIWQQVDLARLYVLRQELLNDNVDTAIYADMDMVLPSLRQGRFYNIIDQYGICLSRFCRNPDVPNGTLENDFFAFDRNFGREYLMSRMIPTTQDAIREGLNGWEAICQANSSSYLFSALGIDHIDEIVVPLFSVADDRKIKASYQSKVFSPSPVLSAPQPL